jgi:hypothetical protein
MQLEGLVKFIVQSTGDLTNLICGAIGVWGEHTLLSVDKPGLIANLTNGIFGTKDGLIYWMKDDFIYLVNNLGTQEMAERLTNFIAALIIGSGATDPFSFYAG